METREIQLWDGARHAASLCLCLCLSCLLPTDATAGPPPVITAQPLDQSVLPGGTAVFTVTVTSGTMLSYQWYQEGGSVPEQLRVLAGETTDVLTLTNVGPADLGTYFVEVKNAGGAVTSRHASLALLTPDIVPIGMAETYTTDEDVPLQVPAPGVLANDTGGVNGALHAIVLTDVTQGRLVFNPDGQFAYLPNANFFGSDQFTYVPYNGTVAGNPVVVTINVLPVDDPPIANNDTVNLEEDGSENVRVLDNDLDPEGASLTVIAAYTTNGTAIVNNSGSGGRVRFTPAPNFSGVVVFSYVVTDGTLSATGLATVTVAPVNDAPVATDDTYATVENRELVIPAAGVGADGLNGAGVLANDTDIEGDALSAVLVSTVSHGALTLSSDGSFRYMPEANFSGVDSFTYHATDGPAAGNVATVNLLVVPAKTPTAITSQRMTPAGFELQIAGKASVTCVIWASPNLRDWSPISTNVLTGGAWVFTDPETFKHDARFYRVESR